MTPAGMPSIAARSWLFAPSAAVVVAVLGCRAQDSAEQAKRRAGDAAAAARSDTPLDVAPDDDALASQYLDIKRIMEADPSLMQRDASPRRAGLETALRGIMESAKAVHLRANAAMLLGSMREASEDRADAIAFYKHASVLVPEEPGPHAALALAWAAQGAYQDAAAAQKRAVEADKDDLAAWLVLGELEFEAGHSDAAAEAYAAYELRRKGLLDGLTLKRGGQYVLTAEERAKCARALSVAHDNGTALALLYAYESDPDASVRAEVVETMGIQRLRGYKPNIVRYLAKEQHERVKQALAWALAEVERAPVDATPDRQPTLPRGAARP